MASKSTSRPRVTIIKVPPVPAKAYNPDRPASGLLRSHVAELEKAAGAIRGRPAKKSMTEGEAARYIRHLTRQLHHEVLAPSGPALSVAPRAVAPTSRAKAASHRKPRSSRNAARPSSRGGTR
jgi:hypothetical protein